MVTVTTGSLSRVFVAVFAWFAFGLSIGSYSFVHAYQDGWVRVEVARDTWVSDFSSERNGSNGAAPRLKLKSIQELSIIDFQPGEFKGKEIAEAKLMLKVAADKPIERVTLSTITADWVEGNGTSYQVVPGASTFRHRSHPKETWYGSDFTAVCIGQGNSLYASVDAKPAKESGWVELDIPPELLLARLHGLSYGIEIGRAHV